MEKKDSNSPSKPGAAAGKSSTSREVSLKHLVKPGVLTIVHTSDTHNGHEKQKGRTPIGDIYIHSVILRTSLTGIKRNLRKSQMKLKCLTNI